MQAVIKNKKPLMKRVIRDFKMNKYAYLLVLPAIAYYIIFHYVPLYGAQIAFRDFNFRDGFAGSPWVGLMHFRDFFGSFYTWRIIRNTLMLSIGMIVFGFPAPIILALLINEVRNNVFKRFTQSITYLPNFISLIVICGFILDFTARDGVINQIIVMLGGEAISFMREPGWFRPVYIISEIWQHTGWASIIYLAALAGIDQELYEACRVDGGGRFRQLITVTLPGIAPTIIILLIIRMGTVMHVGLEKVLLLYNPIIYETADIIATFVYRRGLIELNFSYGAAVGLFNSAVNFALLVTVNQICRRYSDSSLF